MDKFAPDWDKFYAECDKDEPIEDVCRVARELSPWKLVYVTARPERARELTEKWLDNNDLDSMYVYMRKDGDHRPATVVKKEIYESIKDEFEVMGVFEDSCSCVKMWRSLGLTCFQVNDRVE